MCALDMVLEEADEPIPVLEFEDNNDDDNDDCSEPEFEFVDSSDEDDDSVPDHGLVDSSDDEDGVSKSQKAYEERLRQRREDLAENGAFKKTCFPAPHYCETGKCGVFLNRLMLAALVVCIIMPARMQQNRHFPRQRPWQMP